jgi:fluoroquinolone transport system ATP-binding protein
VTATENMLILHPMISAQRLSYTHPGAPRPALQDVAFDVVPGEIFGFLGPEGSGKTTLQKILSGLIRDYAGTVAFEGKDLQDWSRDYFERVGVAFELPNLFLRLTSRENLAFAGRMYAGAVEDPGALLERFGLGREAKTRAARLSPEQRLRLGMARAVSHRPAVLFLDEPLGNLGGDILAEKAAGRTVVLCTADKSLADGVCDRVAVLDQGRILAIARPGDLPSRSAP